MNHLRLIFVSVFFVFFNPVFFSLMSLIAFKSYFNITTDSYDLYVLVLGVMYFYVWRKVLISFPKEFNKISKVLLG